MARSAPLPTLRVLRCPPRQWLEQLRQQVNRKLAEREVKPDELGQDQDLQILVVGEDLVAGTASQLAEDLAILVIRVDFIFAAL